MCVCRFSQQQRWNAGQTHSLYVVLKQLLDGMAADATVPIQHHQHQFKTALLELCSPSMVNPITNPSPFYSSSSYSSSSYSSATSGQGEAGSSTTATATATSTNTNTTTSTNTTSKSQSGSSKKNAAAASASVTASTPANQPTNFAPASIVVIMDYVIVT